MPRRKKSARRFHGNRFTGPLKKRAAQDEDLPQSASSKKLKVTASASSVGTVSPGRGMPVKKAISGPLKGGKGFSESGYVPRILLEEKEQECLAKEETIQILNAKVKRLEHLLHLKDIRIEDLQGRIEQSRPTGKR